MLPGTLIAIALIVAIGALLNKRLRERREQRRRPGATATTAIVVSRFDELDLEVARQTCRCGQPLRLLGEGSPPSGARRLRVLTLGCDDCGVERRTYFDVTAAFH